MSLPEQKRLALAAFYAGRISAGELSRRLATGTDDAPRRDDQRAGDRSAVTTAHARA